MRSYEAKLNSTNFIGKVTENDSMQLKFDVQHWLDAYPGCNISLAVKHIEETEAYNPAQTEVVDGWFVWIISEEDVARKGLEEVELHMTLGNTVEISPTYEVEVIRNVVGGTDVPDRVRSWFDRAVEAVEGAENARDEAIEAKDDAESAREDAIVASYYAEASEDAAQEYAGQAISAKSAAESARDAAEQHEEGALQAKAEAIDARDTILGMSVEAETLEPDEEAAVEWDSETGTMSFGIPKGETGQDGYSPVVTITEIEGGHEVNITDATHPSGQSFDVLDGDTAYVISLTSEQGSALDNDGETTMSAEQKAIIELHPKFITIKNGWYDLESVCVLTEHEFPLGTEFEYTKYNNWAGGIEKFVFDTSTEKITYKYTARTRIIDTTTSTDYAWSSSKIRNELNEKVDKVQGMGLSTHDYTTNDKNKLAGIEAQANKTIVDNAMSSSSENPVQNKVINGELMSINQAINSLDELKATKKELKEANRRIHLLEEASVGKLYTQETVSETSYQQTVPSGSLSNAVLGGYGGKSVVWNQLSRHYRETGVYNGVSFTNHSNNYVDVVGTFTETPLYSQFYISSSTIPFKRDGTKYLVIFTGTGLENHQFGISGYSPYPLGTTKFIWYQTSGEIWNGKLYLMAEIGTTVNITGLKASVIDLAKFGASDITSVDDPRIAEIEAYAIAHPEYNEGEIVSADVNAIQTAKDGTVKQTFNIPSSVLSQYPLRSAGSVNDTITYDPQTVDGVTVPKWKHHKKVEKDHFYSSSDFNDCRLSGSNQIVFSPVPRPRAVNANTMNVYFSDLILDGSYYRTVSTGHTQADVDAFKDYVDANGLDIYYPLETEVVTDITELMQGWNGILEVEEGGTITFKQVGDTIFAVPNTVNYLVKTTGGA